MKYVPHGIAVLLPPLILFWLVPFISNTTIGNDYGIFPIEQQMEVAYSRKHGSFPLYIPGFAMGRSQAALTMGQTFHPISWLVPQLPGYWDGHALSLNTLYRLLSLGITHLILLLFLLRLKIPLLPAFWISVITVYNLRMLDLFRYGASLENYTGYLLLCTCLGFLYLDRHRKTTLLATILSTWLLICGGHPQMMYLGLLGAGITSLLLPFVLPAINPELTSTCTWRQRGLFFGTAFACVGFGLLLSAPYVLSFYSEFVTENALRVNQEYSWSLAYSDTPGGALNNLFHPLRTDVHGAFGSSPLILMAVVLPFLLVFGIKVPLSILLLTAVLTTIFLCTLGDATPLHRWFWEYVPLAGTFRTPGRMSMMLPFLLLLAMTWLFSDRQRVRLFGRIELPCAKSSVAALTALLIFLVYHHYLLDTLPEPAAYTPEVILRDKMKDLSLFEQYNRFLPVTYWLGLGTLALGVLYAMDIRNRPILWRGITGALLLTALLVQISGQLRFGTWQTPVRNTKTLSQMDEEKRQKLWFRGSPGFGMESSDVSVHMERAALEPVLARFYRKAIAAANREQAYDLLSTRRRCDQIVIEGIETDQDGPQHGTPDRITLLYGSFNRLVFQMDAATDGWFSLHYPHDGRFRARINGDGARIYRANALENAVFVPRGNHEVEFRYVSGATIIGVLIAAAALLCLGIWTVVSVFRSPYRWIAAGVVAAGVVAMPVTWFHGLYSGQPIETEYTWTTEQLPSPDNLACFRTARMSSIRSFQMPYFYYAGLAVDGDRTGRPFATNPRRSRPWWQVDLGSPGPIGEIHIHDRLSGRQHLPLQVLVSDTGDRFVPAMTVKERGRALVWKVDLKGTRGRFVRLQSGGAGAMSFAEVEVFAHRGPILDDTTDPTGNLRFNRVASPTH